MADKSWLACAVCHQMFLAPHVGAGRYECPHCHTVSEATFKDTDARADDGPKDGK